MWHKPCRTFHPWCLCIKTRCLFPYLVQWFPSSMKRFAMCICSKHRSRRADFNYLYHLSVEKWSIFMFPKNKFIQTRVMFLLTMIWLYNCICLTIEEIHSCCAQKFNHFGQWQIRMARCGLQWNISHCIFLLSLNLLWLPCVGVIILCIWLLMKNKFHIMCKIIRLIVL